MKTFLNLGQWKNFLGVALLICFVANINAGPEKKVAPKTVAPKTVASKVTASPVVATNTVPLESVFEDQLKDGKDPFFPKSTRRFAQIVAPGVVIAPVVPTINQLVLKGISGTATKKFAIINGQTFAPGEKALVKISSGSVSIRCLEIRERSVLVTIEGDPEPKELHLRPL